MTNPTTTSLNEPPGGSPRGAGTGDYLKEAFLFRWNLLFLLGGTAAAALTPLAPVLLPLVGAGELTYLAGLISVPRFRAAIDAKVHASRQRVPGTVAAPAVSRGGSKDRPIVSRDVSFRQSDREGAGRLG